MTKGKLKINTNKNLGLMVKADTKNKNIITVAGFFETHKIFMGDKSLEGLRQSTIQKHIEQIKYFKTFLEHKYQSDINCVADEGLNSGTFKEYIHYMALEKQYSNYTTNVRLRTLKCYLSWLFENKYISDNIAPNLKLLKVDEDIVQPLTPHEVKTLLKTCDTTTYNGYRDYCIALLMLDCGIRVGELVELTIDDVDTKECLITLNGEKAKTGRTRYMPISDKVAKLLKELITVAEQTDCNYLFQSVYGGQIKKQNVILAFRKLGEKAKLTKRCTPHVFRHTFAVNAVRLGMDVFTLQRIMGHSTLLTTRKYIQLQKEDLLKEHNRIHVLDQYLK